MLETVECADLKNLAEIERQYELNTRARDFATLCYHLMNHEGDFYAARDFAEKNAAPSRVVTALKGAVVAGSCVQVLTLYGLQYATRVVTSNMRSYL